MPVTISGDGGIAGISSLGGGDFVAGSLTSSGELIAGPQGVGRATLYVDDSNNRVGINTTTPTRLVQVSDVNPIISVTETSTNKEVLLGANANAGFVGTETNHDFRVITNGVNRVTVNTNGNVGVNTTSAFDQLHINNDASNSFATLRLEGSNRGGQLNFYNGTLPVGQIETDQSGNIFFRSSLGFGNATLTGVAAISSNGRLGIGTSNPDVPLHILANNGIWCQDSANNDLIELRAKNDIAQIGFYNQDNTTDPLPLVFTQYITERMRINTAGNLAFPNGGGIDFSGTQGAGASSSLLDDYEEGTWTPNLRENGAGGPIWNTQTSSSGRYTKIGDTVILTGEIVYTTEPTNVNTTFYTFVSDAPFAFNSANNQNPGSFAITIESRSENTTPYFMRVTTTTNNNLGITRNQNTTSPNYLQTEKFPYTPGEETIIRFCIIVKMP